MSLRIVVCLKVAVDIAELAADAAGAPRLAGAPLRLSTFDEHALEAAVRLREAHGGEVVVLTLAAAPPPDELLLRALAMGADASWLVVDPAAAGADALATATVLAAALERLAPWDLVLCGDGSLDRYDRQVAPRLGELLGVPPVGQVVGVEVDGRRATVERATQERVERLAGELPLVLAVGQEINTPRLPTVLQIMGSARKPRTVWGRDELGVAPLDELRGVETVTTEGRPSHRRRVPWEGDDTDDLARRLAAALLAEGAVKTA